MSLLDLRATVILSLRIYSVEPTPDMIEVAIKSVEGVLDWREYLENERNGCI